MFLHQITRALATILCVFASAGAASYGSAQFSAVQLAGGRTQCSADPPLVTLRTRSKIECAEQCSRHQDQQGGEQCEEFNVRQNNECELFAEATVNTRQDLVAGCTLFQVGLRTDG